MEHDRVLALRDHPERGRECFATGGRHLHVHLADRWLGILAVEGFELGLVVLEKGKVVEVDVVDSREASPLGQLVSGAQVDHRSNSELERAFEVGGGEPVQCVGSEDAAPSDVAAIDRLVAADVSKVEARLERYEPLAEVHVPIVRQHPVRSTA
jgi:hypothetical protein